MHAVAQTMSGFRRYALEAGAVSFPLLPDATSALMLGVALSAKEDFVRNFKYIWSKSTCFAPEGSLRELPRLGRSA